MVLVSLVALVGCKKDEPPPESGPPITFVTYNAGLAVGFVDGADSRTPLVADALANVDADIVCLEEVWLPDQVQAVADATATAFPNQFFPAAQQSTDASCAAGEIDPVVDCLDTYCGGACVDDVPDCLLTNCVGVFLGLSKECQRCAQANVGEEPATVGDTCANAPIEFAYGGSFGTGILSKYPIGPVDEHVFASTSNRRSVLHTTVDVDGAPLELYCTHLTAVFDTIPYPRESDPLFGAAAWAAEQAVQIDEMNALIASNGGDRIALLGDMNTGPAVNGMSDEVGDNYQKFVDAGWSIPYVESDPPCSFCGANPLGSGDPGDDRVIDHVMLKGFAGGATATRILDQATAGVESCGTPIDPGALSDHYGVSVVATP